MAPFEGMTFTSKAASKWALCCSHDEEESFFILKAPTRHRHIAPLPMLGQHVPSGGKLLNGRVGFRGIQNA